MRSYTSEDDDSNSANISATTQFRSWLEWKEQGKRAYEKGDYKQALEFYRTALQPEYECPTKADQAVLWSNVVACRLQLVENDQRGGKDLAQARASVEDAKKCVELNPNWAKGHLRLASAYVALGGHSNDACNELQSVLRIDPGNSTARQMLVRELRREHINGVAPAAQSAQESSRPSTTPDDLRDPPRNPDYMPPSSSTTSGGSSGSSQPASHSSANRETSVDDGLTLRERIIYRWALIKEWYQGLNPEIKTFFKFSVVLLCLYVAFGGRFGFEGRPTRPNILETPYYETTTTKTRGNYGAGNAYDEYRRQKQHEQRYYNSYHQADRSYNSNNDQRYHRRTEPSYHYDTYYNETPPKQNSQGFGFRISDLFDGSAQSMIILAGIAYLCHRNGINPFQAIMMLNLIGGGRRRYGGGYGGGFGYRGFGHRRRGFW